MAPEKPAVAAKATSKVPVKAPAKRKAVTKRAKATAAKTTKTAAKTPKPAIPVFTRDDIALRAYFIAEKRHAHGLPGNEHLDWVEAERQLLAEFGKKKRSKKA